MINDNLSGIILASEKPSPFRGRWHFCPKGAKMTDEVLPKLYAASGYTSSVAFRRQLHHAALRKQQQRHKELDVPQCLIKRGSLAEHSRQPPRQIIIYIKLRKIILEGYDKYADKYQKRWSYPPR